MTDTPTFKVEILKAELEHVQVDDIDQIKVHAGILKKQEDGSYASHDVRFFGFPLETSEDDIVKSMLKLESTLNSDYELSIKNKELSEKTENAKKVIESLTKKEI